jgi:hypothetical protein
MTIHELRKFVELAKEGDFDSFCATGSSDNSGGDNVRETPNTDEVDTDIPVPPVSDS